MGSEFFYESYEIKPGKPSLDGLPASFGGAEDVTTLEITCIDPVLNLKLILSYSAFDKEDVITRSVKIVNTGKQQVRLEKVYSACLDMDNENFELLTLHGSWARRASYPAPADLLWKAARIFCKGRIRTSGASVYCTCNTGNKPATGQSLRNAFCVFR